MGTCLCKKKKAKASRHGGHGDGASGRLVGRNSGRSQSQAHETNSDDAFPYTSTGTADDNNIVVLPNLNLAARLSRQGMCIQWIPGLCLDTVCINMKQHNLLVYNFFVVF